MSGARVAPAGSRLEGRVCIITGAASGIGLATARLFAGQGALVVIADADLSAGEAAAGEITAAGGRAWFQAVDVTVENDCKRLAEEVVARHGRIDVLFNNAGVSGVGVLHETELELWRRVLDVNVLGVFLASKHVVPHMIGARRGSIINMSSAIALTGLANRAPYAASKGAVLALTRSMQVDYAPHGIRVNAILPGTIMTPFVENYLRESYADPEAGLVAIRGRQLTGELGRPEDVAPLALLLASDESRFVMGAALSVDGGLTAGR